MLVTLNYHLGGEVEKLSAIFDDDESKAKSHYESLNVGIQSLNQLVDSESNLTLVTSVKIQSRLGTGLMDFLKSTIIGFLAGWLLETPSLATICKNNTSVHKRS